MEWSTAFCIVGVAFCVCGFLSVAVFSDLRRSSSPPQPPPLDWRYEETVTEKPVPTGIVQIHEPVDLFGTGQLLLGFGLQPPLTKGENQHVYRTA